MVQIPMRFEFLWGWSLSHSSILVLNAHALVTMYPMISGWVFNKAHGEKMKVRRQTTFSTPWTPFFFPL
jgi:hypothetical protein